MTKSLNLALMFLLELAVYASVAYWGFTVSDNWAVRVLVAAGAVVLFGAVWSVFGSPRARVPVHRGPGRLLLELVWFGGGFALLAAAGPVVAAAVLAALFVLNGLLRWRWGQSAGAIRAGDRG